MAEVAPNTGAPERTPLADIRNVSCWISEAEGIVRIALSEIEYANPEVHAIAALYGAASLLDFAGDVLGNAEVALTKDAA